MTTDTDKLIQVAEAAGFRVVRFNDADAYACDDEGKDITPKLAGFRTAIIASLCGDVEPVAWLHKQGAHTELSERELLEDEKERGWTQKPLYPASTVAALKARAAELEDFIVGIGQDLHHERVADWYPEGANNAALAMSESMRLIGNRCVDFDAALKKGQS